MDKLRLFQLFVTIIIASQGIFYLLGLASAMESVSVQTFAETRKAIDNVIANRLRILYYIALASGAIVLFLSREDWMGKVFVYTAIATMLILVDVVLALKGSVPINKSFQDYPGVGLTNWKHLQADWIGLIIVRGMCSAMALVALLLSWSNRTI